MKVDGVVYNSSFDKARILNNYFTSVFTPITMETPPPMSEPLVPDIGPKTNGVVELLKFLEAHKAVGPDEIPAHLLKEFCIALAPLFSKHPYSSVLYHWTGRGHHILYPFLGRVVVLPQAIIDLSP